MKKNKAKNTAALCVLLVAGSVVANPIYSEDRTAFQLNFPIEIQEELSKFISSIEDKNHEHCAAFFYEIDPESLKLKGEIQEDFLAITEAMTPYIDLPWEDIQSRLQELSIVRVYKTLWQLNDQTVFIPNRAAFCIKAVLNYFYDRSLGNLPLYCGGNISFMLRKQKFGNKVAQAVEEYTCALDEIIQSL
jgi:hypothetical protein